MEKEIQKLLPSPSLFDRVKSTFYRARDLGLWFIFFAIIYLVLLIKVATGVSIDNHLFFGIYSFAITFYIFSRFLLAYFHRSEPYDLAYEPSVAFVVPAKNEGDNIAKTL